MAISTWTATTYFVGAADTATFVEQFMVVLEDRGGGGAPVPTTGQLWPRGNP